MAGISSKLCTGGGDDVIHSSVRASHGSFVSSGRCCSRVLTTFAMNTRIDRAIRNAPSVEISFQNVRPSDAGYVYSRRIMPWSPRMCMGPNARLNPMIMIQKCSLPRVSESR